MNRSEALAVMHELMETLRESVIISGVSLDFTDSKTPKAHYSCQIKMNCDLDDFSRQRIQPILDMRNLKIEDAKGAVVIYSP
jgi:hypothetical protein